MPKPTLHTGETPQILDALDLLEGAQRIRADLPANIWETAQQAANKLLSWGAPAPVAVAALLAPLLEHGVVEASALATHYDRDAVALAERLVAWRVASASGEQNYEAATQHS